MKKAAADKASNEARFFTFIDQAKTHLPKYNAQIAEIRQKFEQVLPTFKKAEVLGLANKNEEASAVAESLAPQMRTLAEQFTLLNDEVIKRMNVMSDNTTDTANHTILVTYLSVSAATLVVFLLAFFMVQMNVSGPIARLVRELEKLAEGDFNIKFDGLGRKDEVGQISDAAEMVAERV